MLQLGLDFTDGVHHLVELLGRSVAHLFVQLQHLRFHFVHILEGCAQHLADGHALFQRALLVQIADGNLAGPFNLALVRQDVAGNDI